MEFILVSQQNLIHKKLSVILKVKDNFTSHICHINSHLHHREICNLESVENYLCTWTPLLHNASAVANATLVSCPLRRTWVVPGGILLRTTAAAKLLPSTILNLNFGYF